MKQLNYSKNLATTPFTAAYASYNSKEDNKLENFANATAGATVANTRLLLNQNITAQQLAGDTTLLAYEGDSLGSGAEAKSALSFYDSKQDTAALNSSVTSIMSDSEVASLIGHEAIGHKIGGDSEFVANFTLQAVADNWNIYQSGNTNFNSSLPVATQGSNNYANNIQFNQDIHPFLPAAVLAAEAVAELLPAATALAAAYGFKTTTDLLKNSNSNSSSSNQSALSGSSAAGGMPDPDDENDKFTNHVKERQEQRNISA